MSDIEKRFREEAGLTEREINKAFENTFEEPMDFDHKPTADELFTIQLNSVSQAQLSKALSTKLDGRIRVALIDTKGKLPRILTEPKDTMVDNIRRAKREIQMAGFTHKVVHVFGEDRDE